MWFYIGLFLSALALFIFIWVLAGFILDKFERDQ